VVPFVILSTPFGQTRHPDHLASPTHGAKPGSRDAPFGALLARSGSLPTGSAREGRCCAIPAKTTTREDYCVHDCSTALATLSKNAVLGMFPVLMPTSTADATRSTTMKSCCLERNSVSAAASWGSSQAFLARLLATEIADRDGAALVFESARGGGYLTLGQARYTLGKAVAAVGGIDGVRLHDLRHTCASLAIRSGANVKVVQKLLGHKTAVLTLDRYGHLYPDDLDAVASAFDTAAQSAAGALRAHTGLRAVPKTENTL
jgi:hypothetical protein